MLTRNYMYSALLICGRSKMPHYLQILSLSSTTLALRIIFYLRMTCLKLIYTHRERSFLSLCAANTRIYHERSQPTDRMTNKRMNIFIRN